MIESAISDVIFSGVASVAYIAGLAVFVTWLKRKDVLRGQALLEKA
jgi:hypothetical protein